MEKLPKDKHHNFSHPVLLGRLNQGKGTEAKNMEVNSLSEIIFINVF